MRHSAFRPLRLKSFCLGFGLLAIGAAGFPRAARADDASEHFDKAIKLYKQAGSDKAKMDAALKEFELARDAAPKGTAAQANILFWIGFVRLQQRNYQDALEPLQQAIEIKDTPEAHLNLGNVYDGLGEHEKALAQFQYVTNKQPDNADGWYNLGSALYKLKRYPASASAYKKAAQRTPNTPDNRENLAFIEDNLGTAYQASGDYENALTAYTQATTLLPDRGSFWQNLGLAAQGWAAKLKESSDASTRARSKDALAQARTAFEKAITLIPSKFRDNYQLRESYGETLFDSGRAQDASAQFEKAAALDPKQFSPLFNLALAQTRLNHLPQAADAYRRALALSPDNPDALLNLGLIQYKQGRFADAVKTFTQVTQSRPNDITGWTNLSLALQRTGDDAGAMAALEEGTKHGSGTRLATARRALAGLYFRKGTPDALTKAQELYKQSLQDAPGNAEAYNGLGLIALKQGKKDEALADFKRAVALNPRSGDAFNNLGVAYEANNDLEQARKAYRRALEVDPNNPRARQNLDRFKPKTP